jgi:hypothetical protein
MPKKLKSEEEKDKEVESQEVDGKEDEESSETSENLELTEDQKKNKELMDRLEQLESEQKKDEELTKKNEELQKRIDELEKKKLVASLLNSNKITKGMQELMLQLSMDQLKAYDEKQVPRQTIKDIKNNVKEKDDEVKEPIKKLPSKYVNDPYKTGQVAGFNIRPQKT